MFQYKPATFYQTKIHWLESQTGTSSLRAHVLSHSSPLPDLCCHLMPCFFQFTTSVAPHRQSKWGFRWVFLPLLLSLI